MLLRDVPVPCGAAWDWASAAEVYVEQTATDYQTWFDRRTASHFEITLLGAPVAEIVQESHADGQSMIPGAWN
jgi:hypothetical protein